MPISIQFQHQPDPTNRPNDEADHIDPIEIEDGQVAFIPTVGDSVSYGSYEYDYEANGKLIPNSGRDLVVARKVVSRHFSYYRGKLIAVNIVVGNISREELGMRLKE